MFDSSDTAPVTGRPSTSPRRRRLLATLGTAGLLGVAGCASGGNRGDGGSETEGDDTGETGRDDSDGPGTTEPPATDPTETAAETETTADGGGETTDGGEAGETETDSLDLREANVVAVAVSDAGQSDGGTDYRFDVTLYHDDDGEDGYANWWQVERPDGQRLGRRKLLHAHGTREFTRSETITVPEDVETVVVRGHDQTHGYGGRAALVEPTSGETQFVDQGSERQPLTPTE